MKTSRLPSSGACPYCGHTLDAVTPTPDNPEATPSAGDITICFGCAEVLILKEDLTVRVPNMEEAFYAQGEPQVIQLQRAIRTLIAKRGK